MDSRSHNRMKFSMALSNQGITFPVPRPSPILIWHYLLFLPPPFQGAIPATIAIVDGRIKVGTTADQLARLAQSDTIKTSRRDLAYVLGKGLSGGTTVAGTLLVADMVGIRVFATGGIGGVHRGGEDSLDVSADLVELGRTPVAVVSSGVKSILDIPRTLEYLVKGLPKLA